jgi:hypothetical protein
VHRQKTYTKKPGVHNATGCCMNPAYRNMLKECKISLSPCTTNYFTENLNRYKLGSQFNSVTQTPLATDLDARVRFLALPGEKKVVGLERAINKIHKDLIWRGSISRN